MLEGYELFSGRKSNNIIIRGINEDKSTTTPVNDESYNYKNRAWEKILTATISMSGSYYFFHYLLQDMRLLLTYKVPTMATDGFKILINPRFVLEELTEKETIFVLCHELMHCVLLHMARRGSRNHEKWNSAGDYVINILLDPPGGGAGSMKRPRMALWDTKYEDMTSEQVYDLLPTPPKKKPKEDEEGGDGGDGQGTQPAVGDYVRIKGSSKYGIINDVRADGTYDISEVTKEEIDDYFKQLKESK